MSINKKQKTLLQSWKFNDNEPSCSKKALNSRSVSRNDQAQSSVINLCDDLDDVDLLSVAVAVEQNNEQRKSQNIPAVTENSLKDSDGFDLFAGHLWIYPTNYPVREYQLSIVKTALFKNTLVALPTGLGKTFIAAVVLYNYYRWFPQGKVVFMAPTKPLVSQQIEACFKIMGIPKQDQAQITGATMAANRRSELWASKRVFFATPQVISNDLAKGVCPASSVKCLVIDEAHKALGNHAYCQVVQQLLSHTRNFRVLALSATPGSDLKTVQQVIKNLLISKIELRAEDAIDIQQYTHTRSVDKIVVKLTEQILNLKERYFSVIQMFINNLTRNNALYNKDIRFLTKYALLMARDQFRKDPPSGLPRTALGILEGTFAISISLYHGLELLLQHGMKSFFIFLKGIMDGSKGSARSKTMLYENANFRSIFDELTSYYGEKPDSVVLCTQKGGTQHSSKKPKLNSSYSDSYVCSHPKMDKLEEIAIQHFQNATVSGSNSHATRVMIFCQYRDIVREITELLQRHRPLIRPMQFVGHAPSTNPNEDEKSGSKSNRRFTQKDQLMVVNKFRSGDYNTLVSTCVGEEGLDIGDVDLIICYDSHKSPIRLVQRMGRTGRKRKGRIVMLVTEGKEERDYNSSLASRRNIHKAITGAGGKSLQYYPHNPPMLPPDVHPKCHKMHVTVPEEEVSEASKPKKKAKANKSVPLQPDVSALFAKKAKNFRLSEEQREEYRKKFQLSFAEQKHLKTMSPKSQNGKCIHIDKELWGDNYHPSSAKTLSLTEWLPWQSRAQPTNLVEHSSKSKMLTEVLQFCDNLCEKGPTQCGYQQPAPPNNQLKITNKKTKSQRVSTKPKPDKTALNKAARKKNRKPLIVISDDEDIFLPDDFQELPAFNSKTIGATTTALSRDNNKTNQSLSEMPNISALPIHSEVPKEIALNESLRHENKVQDQDLKTSSFVTLNDSAVLVADSENENKFTLNDSPLSANLSPLNLSPENSSGTESTVKPCCKVSKPKHDVLVHISSHRIDSISFDCLNDPSISAPTKSESRQKPKCFKLYDSDIDKATTSDEEMSKSKNKSYFQSVIADIGDENALLSLLDDTIDSQISKQAIGFKETAAKLSPKIISPIRSAQQVQCSDVNVQSSAARNPSANVTKNIPEKYSAKPCHLAVSSLVKTSESFDVSADMFAPEIDLNFDLGFDDFEQDESETEENIPPSHCSNPQNFQNPAKTDKNLLIFSETNSSITDDKNTCLSKISETEKLSPESAVPITPKVTLPLSPISKDSFNLSQTKRLENQKLFSEFNTNVHSPPCAKVKPQIKVSNTIAEDSCPLIAGSPVQEKPDKRTFKRKQSTTKRSSPFPRKMNENSDDDFLSIDPMPPHNVKKQRFSTDNGNDYLFIPPEAVISTESDEEFYSQHELPFKDIHSSDPYFRDANKSPVLSLTAKKKRRNTPTATPKSQSTAAQILLVENTKHSTPKADPSQVKSESDFSDESIIGRRPLHKRRGNGRNMFVCDEADVSAHGGSASSDEEINEDELDEEMREFVNDATLLTQFATQKPDDKAIYLRSLHNLPSQQQRARTETLAGRYKLAYGVGENIDVFSQVPEEDVSDYENDSFCVENDELLEASDLGEVTLFESPFNDDSVRKPKTRAQAKLKEAISRNPPKKKPRRRMVIFDDENDASNSSLNPSYDSTTAKQDVSRKEVSCRRIVDITQTPARHCELCDSVVNNKGWLCKDCIAVMKKSEMAREKNTTTTTHKEEKRKEISKSKVDQNLAPVPSLDTRLKPKENQIPFTLTLTKEERLKRSKMKQEEFKNKLKLKRSSLDANENLPATATSSLTSSVAKSPYQSTLKTKHSPVRIATPLTSASSIASPLRNEGKLIIFLDNKELNANAVQMASSLRTTYNVNVQVVSLKCCSCVVSRRCAVIRRMVDDVTNVTKKQKLALLIKQARQYYEKLYVIIEKNKVKKGWMTSRPSSAHASRLTSSLLQLAQGGVHVLHSESQENSAQLLHMLAEREQAQGQFIHKKILRNSTDEKQSMMNIYLSLPGVSYIHALYMCQRFRSLKQLISCSSEMLVAEIQLSADAVRNLRKFLRKKFDVQMTPLS